MQQPVIAFVTIGQSPRPDLSDAIEQALPGHSRCVHAGVLDGLTDEQIATQYGVRDSDFPLITRLSDGRTVSIAEPQAGQGLQRLVDRLEAEGVHVIVVLCTGHFPDLRARRAWLLEPDRVVVSVVRSLAGNATLGLVAPLQAQLPQICGKWSQGATSLPSLAASPYGPIEDLVDAAAQLQAQGAEAIVLDCMGYNEDHKRALLAHEIAVPVFVSASVLASAIGTLF